MGRHVMLLTHETCHAATRNLGRPTWLRSSWQQLLNPVPQYGGSKTADRQDNVDGGRVLHMDPALARSEAISLTRRDTRFGPTH
jgi:hypothetical protein